MDHTVSRRAKRRGALVTAALLMLVAAAPAAANHGALDTTFANGGFARTDFGANEELTDLLVQPDRKILAVGSRQSGTIGHFAAARYSDRGILDPAFAGDGTAVYGHFSLLGETSTFDEPLAVVMQPDGKIVMAGIARFRGFTGWAFRRIEGLARPDAPHRSDASFGADLGTPGAALHTPAQTALGEGSGVSQFVTALAIQTMPDGSFRIIAAGTSAGRFAVMRLRTDGIRDRTFSGDGLVLARHITHNGQTATHEVINDVAVQSDGRIVVAGTALFGTDARAVVSRYTRDGLLDSTFGANGRVVLDEPGSSSDSATTIDVLADRRIVVSGGIAPSGQGATWIARLTATGELDPTFRGNRFPAGNPGRLGSAFVNVLDGRESAAATFVNPRGQYVTAISASSPCYPMTQHNPDGELDRNFGGGDGIQFGCFFSAPGSRATAIAPQPSELMVVGGTISDSARSISNFQDFGLNRFHGAGDTVAPRGRLRLLDRSPRRGRLHVAVTTSEAARLSLVAVRRGGDRSPLARGTTTVYAPGGSRAALRLTAAGRSAIGTGRPVRVVVRAVARDPSGNRRTLRLRASLR